MRVIESQNLPRDSGESVFAARHQDVSQGPLAMFPNTSSPFVKRSRNIRRFRRKRGSFSRQMGPRHPPPPTPGPSPPPPLSPGRRGFTENPRGGVLPGGGGGGRGRARGVYGEFGGGGKGAPRLHLPRKRAPFSTTKLPRKALISKRKMVRKTTRNFPEKF